MDKLGAWCCWSIGLLALMMTVLLMPDEGRATIPSTALVTPLAETYCTRCCTDPYPISLCDRPNMTRLAFQYPARHPAKQREPAPGILLVASPKLLDPNFSKTVVLLIEHSPLGTMGIVLNRPTNVLVSAALPELQALAGNSDTLRVGGPVAIETISSLVKTTVKLDYARAVLNDVYFINTMDALSRLLMAKHPETTLRFFAGYAGWAPRQLEHELLNGSWYLLEADLDLIFNRDPKAIWPELIEYAMGQWARNDSYTVVVRSFDFCAGTTPTAISYSNSAAIRKFPNTVICFFAPR